MVPAHQTGLMSGGGSEIGYSQDKEPDVAAQSVICSSPAINKSRRFIFIVFLTVSNWCSKS